MKIGIITFHWGTNYGGVLQAFALQEFIKKLGAEVQIINYAPYTFRDSFFRCFRTKRLRSLVINLLEYTKELRFKNFRQKHLNTTRRYYSLDELKKHAPKMDVYITGSDQVWNPYFLNTYGQAYFLDFGNNNVKRIAYAVSLGCTNYPTELLKKINPYLERFSAISVRENTGLIILNEMGFHSANIMTDPTLLLQKEDYEKIMVERTKKIFKYAFFYVLQKNQLQIKKVYNHVNDSLKIKTLNTLALNSITMGISEWLNSIRNAQFVVTNSFHGVIFSIIFQKQFIVIPIEGSLAGMNDRIYTLLEKFGLNDRIIETFDETKFSQIIYEPVNWDEIRKIKYNLQTEATSYLNESIFQY